MARASPVISATDVPLIRSATPNPAIWEGVAAPSMISFMAHSLSSAVSESPRISAPSSAGHVVRASMAAPWVGLGRKQGNKVSSREEIGGLGANQTPDDEPRSVRYEKETWHRPGCSWL